MPVPTEIKLHRQSRVLELHFDDGSSFNLTCEYLRVHSPSAEVRGHGPGQEVLQVNKEDVNITRIEPVGEYAVRLHFDDGHNSGLYGWEFLHELGRNQEQHWQRYLDRLREAGYQRRAAD
ncbi:DUF971 family protein [Natronocella acetinitrilica]|jgi:DUF971 family protein|uniref:DUF971 family protein n=1 Tax=Natronocella acetinitrilica TaxID=414046 RepID=A0AAE3KAF5_9GAMM|nr:DUF971 domain-containing protein [Natronocella acetinitrilica]MCP1673341.1 DUF971 family protein [Natronocella acetinitrilica]